MYHFKRSISFAGAAGRHRYFVEIGFNSVTHDGGSGSNTFALKQVRQFVDESLVT